MFQGHRQQRYLLGPLDQQPYEHPRLLGPGELNIVASPIMIRPESRNLLEQFLDCTNSKSWLKRTTDLNNSFAPSATNIISVHYCCSFA